MSDTIKELLTGLDALADPAVKAWWENYIKESAPFRGVKMASIRKCLRSWYHSFDIDRFTLDEQFDLALILIRAEYSEDKLAGILFLQEILLPKDVVHCQKSLDVFAQLFIQKYIYDWNICDWFCVKVLGPLIQKEGMDCARMISQWHTGENLWQARASLVAFVKVADDRSYYQMIKKSIDVVIQRKERFAKTAVGWILREIYKHDSQFVRSVLDDHIDSFTIESLRNALKYENTNTRKKYLELLKKKSGG